MTGKAEGLLEAGAEADFPIMFAEAIMEYNKSRELSDEEIKPIIEKYFGRSFNVILFDFAMDVIKTAREE